MFQNNVARSDRCHEIALTSAAECGADVIMIQEPWLSDGMTKTHPAFDTFLPTNSNNNNTWASSCKDTRPRVVTYISYAVSGPDLCQRVPTPLPQ
jgi:hypothetical protein